MSKVADVFRRPSVRIETPEAVSDVRQNVNSWELPPN